MKTLEETQAAVEILLLSEGTRNLITATLRNHLCYIMNSTGKEQQDAITDMIQDFKNIGLA